MIQTPENPRAGWEAAFTEMRANGDDVFLDGDEVGGSSWDEEEWEWE